MAKHTRGPWRSAERFGTIAIEAEMSCINGLTAWADLAFVVPDATDQMFEGGIPHDGNIALIAAAPLMLEALKRIRDNCADNDPENWIWRTAEQAIAQAEGR